MGKPGGFFKRLKAKQKRQGSRQRRGTKGASKEERRAKHNARVDYYAAKREAEELAAISSSDSGEDHEGGAVSTDSEAELRREEHSLMRLRQVLRVGDGGKHPRAKRKRSGEEEGINNNNNNGGAGEGNGEDASKRTNNGNKDNNKHDKKKKKGSTRAVDELSEDSEDWRAYLSSEEEEIEEEEIEEEGDVEEMEDQEMHYGDYAADEDEEEEEEESEELDIAKEDAYEDDDDDDDAGEKETSQLLPQFHHGTTSLSALQHVVSATDPWFVKYHQDRHGDIDTTPMEEQPSGDNRISLSASAHAVQHFLHKPFALKSASTLDNGSAGGVGQREETREERPPYMHETLWKKWLEYCTAESRGPMTQEERGLLDLLQGYPDVIDCCRSWENADSRREIFLLHVLNHWFKARSVVLAHDALLRERRAKKKEKNKKHKSGSDSDRKSIKKRAKDGHDNEAEDDDDDEEYELRDRGFGKTRLLIMLPMRNIAHRYMMTLVKLLRASTDDCAKLSTFDEDFSELAEAMDPTFKRRPREYQMQFAGNVDDAFCVGVRLAPSHVRVYTHPLNSDLLLCSPLGLRRRLERSGDAAVSLSSVEVCVVDEAHVLLMQNWQHAAHVLGRLVNKRPTDTTYGLADMRRVYGWALAGHSGRHRQTIMSTNVSHATLLATVRAACVNNSGRVLLQRREEAGVLSQVLVPVRQHFIRFEPPQQSNLEGCDEARFDFFTQEVFATRIGSLVQRDVRTIIFVPSYFDFVRLRNYMIREHRDTFAAISEYTSLQQQRKALGQFSDLERPLLLVTERFYFFKRYFVKLAEVMVFYSPPVFPAFYVSLVNRLVASSPNAFALTLFCRFDTHELNRIAGTRRTRQLLEREADTFSFVTN